MIISRDTSLGPATSNPLNEDSFTSLVNSDVNTMNFPRILQLPRCIPSTRAFVSSPSSPRNLSTGAQRNTSAPSSPWTRRLIYAGIFGGLGIGAGKLIGQRIAPPPVPGSPEDQKQLERLERAYEIGLPIVKQLRDDPDYAESGVYEYFSDEQKAHRLTSGPLAGSRGLGLQVRLPCQVSWQRQRGHPFLSWLVVRSQAVPFPPYNCNCRSFSMPNLGIPSTCTNPFREPTESILERQGSEDR